MVNQNINLSRGSSKQTICLTYSHHGHQTILCQDTWKAFKYFLSKTDGDSQVLIDATTNLPVISNMDLSGLSHDKNRPSFATSVSQSHSQQSSQQTQAKDTPVCKSKLQLVKEKEFSKVYISSFTKEEREQCLRELFKSMQSDKICKSCSKFKSGHTMKSVKTDLSEDETPENIKKFFTTTEKIHFLKKGRTIHGCLWKS